MAEHRAAVIGSGLGGLAAALRLQAMGVQTTLFEARHKPGGRAGRFEEAGHCFDMGPTIVTEPGCLRDLYASAGTRLEDHIELLPLEPFYRLLWEDGTHFDATGDSTRLHAEVERIAPGEVAGLEAFARYSEAVYREGYERLARTSFGRLSSMLRVLPQLFGLRAWRSVYGVAASHVRSERLRQALSFHPLFVGGDPFATSAVYALIHHLERTGGVHFVRGGTYELVRTLAQLFKGSGGELRLGTPVQAARGTRKSHELVTPKGSERFDCVVSNADVMTTYGTLYGVHHRRARLGAARLRHARWSMGLFVLYFGTTRSYSECVQHHTILFGQRYRELIHEIFHGREVPADFSLYLHAPTVTDPSLAPPGGGTFYVLSPVPNLERTRADWAERGERYAEALLEALEQRLMPDLRRYISVRRWVTPEYFRDELGAWQGNGFSLAPVLWQSAWLRPHNRSSLIPGLYLTGAGTHPGAGIPGVVNAARVTADLVREDLGL